MYWRGLRSSWVTSAGGDAGECSCTPGDSRRPLAWKRMPGSSSWESICTVAGRIVRTTESGDPLETVRISNGVDSLTRVMARAGVSPEVVLEATYGWYWVADVLQGQGASTHLAHPLRVKAFSYRRVKYDVRDATDLADLLRMGRLPEAWIAPPATRELRELVRHRAKLVLMPPRRGEGMNSSHQGAGARVTGDSDARPFGRDGKRCRALAADRSIDQRRGRHRDLPGGSCSVVECQLNLARSSGQLLDADAADDARGRPGGGSWPLPRRLSTTRPSSGLPTLMTEQRSSS